MADLPNSIKEVPTQTSLGLIYGNVKLRSAFEREILIAEKDFMAGTIDTFIPLQAKLNALKGIYEKAKSQFNTDFNNELKKSDK